jgi:hypothetical protein
LDDEDSDVPSSWEKFSTPMVRGLVEVRRKRERERGVSLRIQGREVWGRTALLTARRQEFWGRGEIYRLDPAELDRKRGLSVDEMETFGKLGQGIPFRLLTDQARRTN